jgi:hypothetical protein
MTLQAQAEKIVDAIIDNLTDNDDLARAWYRVEGHDLSNSIRGDWIDLVCAGLKEAANQRDTPAK